MTILAIMSIGVSEGHQGQVHLIRFQYSHRSSGELLLQGVIGTCPRDSSVSVYSLLGRRYFF